MHTQNVRALRRKVSACAFLIFTLLSCCEHQAACLCIVDPFTVGALALRFCALSAAGAERWFLLHLRTDACLVNQSRVSALRP